MSTLTSFFCNRPCTSKIMLSKLKEKKSMKNLFLNAFVLNRKVSVDFRYQCMISQKNYQHDKGNRLRKTMSSYPDTIF